MPSFAKTAAFIALAIPSANALGLRGSAFVPAVAPCSPSTALNMGSMVNKPGANGNAGGPMVGTAKQRKQLMKQADEDRKVLAMEREKRIAEKKAAREN
mmetsp:Transcript_12990/g.29868  ORF Transcript_12990/g.29868 Transcript_12990/m.29868 type:complete len:99 (+) Transcript_12990:1-297(+)